MQFKKKTVNTGWVVCDYTNGDQLVEVKHGEVRTTYEKARQDLFHELRNPYDGIRWVGEDGYLYVEKPGEEGSTTP